nr:unnamed protein product [Digitaria exilis]
MEGAANWRPTQGADPAAVAAAAGGVDPNAAAPAGGDWRTQLQPEARNRIVNKIMETLKKHLPVSVPEGLSELHKIAVRFEEKIYTAATNQSDYLRKISLKMLSMESQTKQNPGNAQVIPNQNPPGPASGLPPQGSNPAQSSAIPLMAQQQTRQPNASTSVQGSLPSLGQSLPGVSQTSTLQNMPGMQMQQNAMTNGLVQGAQQDMYAAQRQMHLWIPLLKLAIQVQLRTTPRQSLTAAVSDIGSVVSMIDRIAGSAPGNGSRAAVGEDLVAMTKCRLQARNFITHDGSGTSKKIKRDTSAMPLNVSSPGSVNDSFKQSYIVDTPELQSTATSRVKWQKAEVNHALMEEIHEINQQLIDTELHISEDDAESFATTSEGGEGTVIRCTFTAVAVSPSLKSMFASAQMSPILPLRLLVPASYPKCSPVLLDKFPDEQSRNSDDLSTKAKSKFGILLRGLSEPMSLREIARTWDACARKVIAETVY